MLEKTVIGFAQECFINLIVYYQRFKSKTMFLL